MKVALTFFFVLTSLSLSFATQDTAPVACRGKSLSITSLQLPWLELRGEGLPLRFGGTRQMPPLQFPADAPFHLIIKNRDEFSKFWKGMFAKVPPDQVPPPVEIDFSKEIVVVSAMGYKMSLGSSTFIDGACEVDGRVEVFISNVDGPCGAVLGIPAAPADAARIPRTDLPIVFRETQFSCTQWQNELSRRSRRN
ncbi:MAG TPA: hypothetical protein VFZ22_09910 [Pyrinomonadaceae bacterium]|nr:hypothetical protein [Pyrinomonadaceae bacterium]